MLIVLHRTSPGAVRRYAWLRSYCWAYEHGRRRRTGRRGRHGGIPFYPIVRLDQHGNNVNYVYVNVTNYSISQKFSHSIVRRTPQNTRQLVARI